MVEAALKPDVRQFLDYLNGLNRPKGHEIGAEAARQMMIASRHAFEVPARGIAVVRDIAGPVPLRLYDAREERAPGPVLLFIHGGGWVLGDLDTHEPFCIDVAIELDLPVVAVDYRLAPEHPFPAAVEDSIAAARWVASGAEALRRTATGLFLAGDSAGGNLAAVVALAARDAGGPALAGQVLIYPATDFAMTHGSHSEPETSVLLTHSVIRWFRDHYLDGAADIHDWRASPARAQNLAGLPPAYVLTAGADPLRDEGDEYAARLKQAGVSVTTRHYPGQFHGFFTMGKLLQQANVAVGEIGAWLKALG